MVASLSPDQNLNTLLDTVADSISTHGCVVLDNALPANLAVGLLQHFKSLDDEKFRRAGIGRENDFQVNRFVRTDEIHWLDGSHPVTREYFEWMEYFREGMNLRLFLGLFDYECHYAYYDAGAFYKKHVDALRGSNTRILSTVLYLNPDWTPDDGGELVMYTPDGQSVIDTIAPRFDRLVVFLSEEFPHEVLPTKVSRYSLTGWFRKNNSMIDSIDPVL